MPEYRIEWPHIKPTKVLSYRIYGSPLSYMAGICSNRLKGEDTGSNWHIFLNSVEGIDWIIRNAGLTPDNTRVICSQSSGKQNAAKLHGFPTSSTKDTVRMFNFYTSTAFEGCDIYDERGRTFIVSEPYKTHTMPDISTSFIQIAGRVRNSTYGGEVIHLYGITGNRKTVSPDEFEKATWEAVEKAEHDMEHINALSDELRASIIRNLPYLNGKFIREEDGKLSVDRDMARYEIVGYRVVNGVYSSQITVEDEMRKNGISIEDSGSITTPKNIQAMTASRTSFKEIYRRYSEIRHGKPIMFTTDWEIELAEAVYPFIRDAYTKLGDQRIKALKYRVGAIQDALTAMSKADTDLKIVEMADRRFPKQTPIPVKKIKEELQKIYDTLGISRRAKSTDMGQWYDTTTAPKRIDGKNVSCMTIIRSRFVRTDF